MMRLPTISLTAMALAGFAPPPAARADTQQPECAVGGRMAEDGLHRDACVALSRHLAQDFADIEPTDLRFVLAPASPRAMSGRVERVDGSGSGPCVRVDVRDGPLTPADIDHFAQTALTLFLSR